MLPYLHDSRLGRLRLGRPLAKLERNAERLFLGWLLFGQDILVILSNVRTWSFNSVITSNSHSSSDNFIKTIVELPNFSSNDGVSPVFR